MPNILTHIIERIESHLASLPKKARKSIGQFFTSRETAAFMASLFQVPADLSQAMILDAGAGTGILSAALVERLQDYQATLNSIHLIKRIVIINPRPQNGTASGLECGGVALNCIHFIDKNTLNDK